LGLSLGLWSALFGKGGGDFLSFVTTPTVAKRL
jgi:hypothetical protein